MYNNRHRQSGGLPAPKRSIALARKSNQYEDSPILKRILISSLFGLGVNALSGLILLSAVCFIAYSSPDPLSLIPPLSLLALLPSNFLGGFACAKKCGEAPMPCGCVAAAMWSAVSFIGALCLFSMPSSGYALWQGLLLHGSSFAFCILGALAGNIKRKPSHKKRRFG